MAPECVLICEGKSWQEAVGLPAISRLSDSVDLMGTAMAQDCAGSLTYRWEAGDGSAPEWRSDLTAYHYPEPGTYTWRFTVWAGTTACSDIGEIQVLADEKLVVLDGSTPLADGQTSAVDFGAVVVRGPGATRTFTVRNDGGYPIDLGAVTVPAGYTVVDGLTGPLAGGAADTFTVRLESAVLGPHAGSIEFWASAQHGGYFSFPVTGVVRPPRRPIRRHL